ARRSCQTAMFHILEALVRWLAPVLSFTAEEIWQHIPWRVKESVFFSTWYEDLFELNDRDALSADDWQQLMRVRDEVNKQLETQRNAGIIGSGLSAEVTLYADAPWLDLLNRLGHELRFALITSQAQVLPAEKRAKSEAVVATDMAGLWVAIKASDY